MRLGLQLRGTPPSDVVCGTFTVRISVEDIEGNTNETSYQIDISCGDHGNCNETTNQCECHHLGYFGASCDQYTCFGYNNTDLQNVCSGEGECVDIDSCQCVGDGVVEDGILGPACNCTKGEVVWGPYCNLTTCSGINNTNTSFVCSGRGECKELDNCTCFEVYNGIVDPELDCLCLQGLFGENCMPRLCYGVLSTDLEHICSGHGECVSNETCSCVTDYYGVNCNITVCGEFFSNESEQCHGHGECNIFSRTCNCTNSTIYTGDFCEKWSCFDREVTLDPEFVCSGEGNCVDYNNCSCNDGYWGDNCELWTCFDYEYWSEGEVCGGHGSCFSLDECTCHTGYFSLEPDGECTEYTCYGLDKSDVDNVCSGKGECTEFNFCSCVVDYDGDTCETFSCGGMDRDDTALVCSGRGTCVSPDDCECSSSLYYGTNCEQSLLLIIIVIPAVCVSLISVLVLAFICFCSLLFLIIACFFIVSCSIGCVFCVLLCFCSPYLVKQTNKAKKLDQIKDVEMVLKEQELDDDTSIAHLKINKNFFQIHYTEIKILKILGEGGSNSVVYKSSWKGRIIAFKCFKTRLICSSQENYDEFEREVEVLGSISHPNIIRYFGATLKPPRVGIVMEFCENGDLDQYLGIHRSEEKVALLKFEDKLRIATEICFAMDYLHTRSIIHRDLKLENVLLDSQLECRVMDFGLSRIIKEMDSKTKTKRVGTSYYIAPDVVLSSYYNQMCDVYSFSILLYILFSEEFDPFYDEEEQSTMGIEIKVASDPSYRPKISTLKDRILTNERKGKKTQKFLEDIIVTCWNHEPTKRLSFEEIGKKIDEKREELLEDDNILQRNTTDDNFSETEEKETQEVSSSEGKGENDGSDVNTKSVEEEEMSDNVPVEGSLRKAQIVTDISSELDFSI